jgi:hypothetical protein
MKNFFVGLLLLMGFASSATAGNQFVYGGPVTSVILTPVVVLPPGTQTPTATPNATQIPAMIATQVVQVYAMQTQLASIATIEAGPFNSQNQVNANPGGTPTWVPMSRFEPMMTVVAAQATVVSAQLTVVVAQATQIANATPTPNLTPTGANSSYAWHQPSGFTGANVWTLKTATGLVGTVTPVGGYYYSKWACGIFGTGGSTLVVVSVYPEIGGIICTTPCMTVTETGNTSAMTSITFESQQMAVSISSIGAATTCTVGLIGSE